MPPIRHLTAWGLLAGALLQPAFAQPNEPPMNIPRPGFPAVRPAPDRGEAREREAMREINSRIREANDRIERAARRGRLAPHETRRLRGEVQELRAMERRMGRDGHVDRREREALHRRVDGLERHIRQEIRD